MLVSSSQSISGAEISLKQLLEKIDHEFQFFLIGGNKSYFKDIKLTNFLLITPIINKCSWIKFVIQSFRNNYICIKQLRQFKPELIYFNGAHSFLNLIWVALYFFNTKKIWHVRDVLKSKMVTRLLSFLSDKIVCNSKFISEQFKNTQKKECIYGGIDVFKYKGVEPDTTKHLRMDANVKTIACIAQLTPWKNQIDFIKAARLIYDENPNIKFLIVGEVLNPKDQYYKIKLQEEIEALGLNGIVCLKGFVEDITTVISKIDVLIHPATNEPFGRVLIESMSMNKPIVSYQSGGALEIVKHNETGYLVSCYNYKKLAEYTLVLLNNDKLRRDFGVEGRKRIIEKFNIENHIKKMKQVFSN